MPNESSYIDTLHSTDGNDYPIKDTFSGYITLQDVPVQSVAGKTGAVTLSASDVGLGNVSNVAQYSVDNPPPYPVTSVNGMTGSVDTYHFGTCSTSASTTAKTVSISGITSLTDGLVIHVRFNETNSATTPTLNVNSLGAVTIRYYGTTTVPTNYWRAGAIVELVYYNSNWVITSGGAASTTYYGPTKLSDSVSSTSTSLAATANAVRQVKEAIPTQVSSLTNDAGYITSSDIPTKLSDLTNDEGFITNADIPTALSDLTNDTGFVTAAQAAAAAPVQSVNGNTGAVTITVPTKVSDLSNDSGFIVANSPALTGVPTAPTAQFGTDSTQIATTAFVQDAVEDLVDGVENTYAKKTDVPAATSTTPKMDGTASVGSETTWAKGDHRHPTDTSRAPLASPAFTGTPTAPNPSPGDDSTQIATTTFVMTEVADAASIVEDKIPVASSTTPKMDGTAAVGTNTTWARGDHVHPTDTTRAPLASPALTGTPTAPTAAAGTNTTQIATTAFVKTAVDNKSVPSPSSTTPKMDGTASTGSEAAFSRGDHIHPTDTSRAPLASPAFTGTPTAPTAASGTSTTQIATTAFVDSAIDEVYADIPTSVSELTNDSGFITANDIPSIPSKTSDLTNDSGFITSADLPTKTSDLTNDSGFITSSSLPTKVSDLTNDSGFVNSAGASAAAPVQSVNGSTGTVVLTSSDVGALATTGGSVSGQLTLGNKLILNSNIFGDTLPTDDYTAGRIFFKKV